MFLRELDAESGEMGAFQAMSVFAEWLGYRIEQSPDSLEVLRAFQTVEGIASSNDYPLGRELVTEFVEVLRDNPRAISLMGPETLLYR